MPATREDTQESATQSKQVGRRVQILGAQAALCTAWPAWRASSIIERRVMPCSAPRPGVSHRPSPRSSALFRPRAFPRERGTNEDNNGLMEMLPEREKKIPGGDLEYPWEDSRFALSPAPWYSQIQEAK